MVRTIYQNNLYVFFNNTASILPSLFTKLAFIGMIPLLILTINPAYAIVTLFTIQKDVYADEDSIVFIGTESEGRKMISVALYNPNGKFVNMLGDPSSDLDGSFETTPKLVKNLFTTTGRYNATGFTDMISEGITLFLNYDGDRISIIPNFVLDLIKIGNKSVTEILSVKPVALYLPVVVNKFFTS